MAIRIVQLGTPRNPDEGIRIGTVRRPPRGVPKSEYASRDFYDTWLPNLSPSPELMKEGKSAQSAAAWSAFAKKFQQEMNTAENSKILDLLAALSHQTQMSIGCYCDDENRCHRSLLKKMLKERGASMADDEGQ